MKKRLFLINETESEAACRSCWCRCIC